MNLDQKFEKYHAENPKVYELFKKYATTLKDNGHFFFGAKAIMERIRWHLVVETKGDQFKVNNNYTSRYARLLIKDDPSFTDFFETRNPPSKEVA